MNSAFPTAPIVKWAGGKRWLLTHLSTIDLTFQNRRLVEPFCGGLAVSLGLGMQHAHLNDANPHLINLYRQIKKGFTLTLRPRNNLATYNRYRQRFNRLISIGDIFTHEAAELFYVLNKMCFNGLCRFNLSGQFNTPFGQYKQFNLIRDFSEYQRRFRHWRFHSKDFSSVKSHNDDIVYADPPYDGVFTNYTSTPFSWSDQARLVDYLVEHQGPVILSNAATERVCKLYKRAGFTLLFLNGPRRISCDGNRDQAKELLAVKNLGRQEIKALALAA
jgi:DNA adenine methylase